MNYKFEISNTYKCGEQTTLTFYSKIKDIYALRFIMSGGGSGHTLEYFIRDDSFYPSNNLLFSYRYILKYKFFTPGEYSIFTPPKSPYFFTFKVI